jgi:hypothetical protein
MYNFIFSIVYRDCIDRGKQERSAKFRGSVVVVISIMLHLLTIIAVVKRLLFIYGYISHEYISKEITHRYRPVTCLIFILTLIGVNIHYTSDRIKVVLARYIEKQGDSIKLLLSFAIPLIIFMILAVFTH